MISEGEGVLPFEHLYLPVAEYIKKAPRARRQINRLVNDHISMIRRTGFDGGEISFNYQTNENKKCLYGRPFPPAILAGVRFDNGIEISRNIVIIRGEQKILSSTLISALVGGPLSRAIDIGQGFDYSDATILAIRNMTNSIRITIDIPPATLCWSELQR